MIENPENSGINPAENAEDLSQELETTAQNLEAIEPLRVSPEQFGDLEAKVDIVVGVLLAYLGVKAVEFGLDISSGILSSGDPSALAGLERLTQMVGSMTLAFPGGLAVAQGTSRFIKGLEHLMEKSPN